MLLAQILGLYFMIIGVVVLYRRRAVMPAVSRLVANRPLLLVIGLMEILGGIAIVLTYPMFTLDASGLISLIGLVLLIEGIVYFALPSRKVQRFVRRFNTPSWYGAGGLLSLIMGVYLAGSGFGLF
ncbi:MAG: putative rane protein [Candidatus Kaiserbacteria bacterium]|nr:putative rane protein [Candidatus Kaiserbacteria bacterium]